jgi:peptide/nickel transport system permease protein
VAGGVVVPALVALATLGVRLSPYAPTGTNLRNRFSPPSPQNCFGADTFGRDIFTRVAAGAQMSMMVGLVVVAITGLAITIAVLGFNLPGDGLRDVPAPHLPAET